ncbi:Xanthine dehydrogenase 1 [Nymphaea thermarum]|nr:Xanthine dehydrogenase 1 [Nymphaea thermarum]
MDPVNVDRVHFWTGTDLVRVDRTRNEKGSHIEGVTVDAQPTAAREHLFGQVYVRKEKATVEDVVDEDRTNPNPVISPDDPSPSNEEFPIALRKGTRSCTSHPIQRFSHVPLQKYLAYAHGSQCGFCTPGFVMSMYALLRSSKGKPTEEQIEEALAGNLCRCTGYRAIVDAFKVFAKKDDPMYTQHSSPGISSNAFVCPLSGKQCTCGAMSAGPLETSSMDNVCSTNYKHITCGETVGSSYSDKELIFPPELLLRKMVPLSLSGFGGIKWFRPLNLEQVLDLKSRYPDARLIVGNTEVGIETRFKDARYQVLILVAHVPELCALVVKDDGLEIGSAVRLTTLSISLKEVVSKRSFHETSACRAILEQLKWFAGNQIKNVASVGGNICTASPISDLNPLWIASRAEFRIVDCQGNIRTTLANNFFKGYRRVDLRHNEILLSIFLPWTRHFEYVKEFKQAHRRDDDIALVNAGMRILLEKNGMAVQISEASIVYGGIAPIPYLATKTEFFLKGKDWGPDLLDGALDTLKDEMTLADDAPGGMVEFRKSLTLSFFFKLYLWITVDLEASGSIIRCLQPSYLSAVQPYKKVTTKGVQNYEIVKHGKPVGSPIMHLSAEMQVSGEAEYTDDAPMPSNGLHAALVLSSKPHARILSIDDSEAKSSPGFMGLFLARDVPGSNKIGPILHDEELFASEFVTCVGQERHNFICKIVYVLIHIFSLYNVFCSCLGQVIGIVVADAQENAKLASKKVKVQYEELPAVLTIKDALRENSFYPNAEIFLHKGDVELFLGSGSYVKFIEGEVQVGGQEHFYMEPQSSLVWTVDGGNEVHMVSSTQSPQKHQKYVAHVLNLPMSKVVCKTKRIGGGFGGKETRSAFIAAAASIPAYLLRRPVKLTLDRDVDMMITGQRHSFLGKYKVGFTNEGKVLALDLEIYNNAGNSLDLSYAVLERAIFHSDNVYDIPNVRIRGKVCYTNLPSNTAFRGFGGPQGMLITENWIQRIAMELHKCSEEIREINFQHERSVTHYGQPLENCTLGRVWDELKTSSEFVKARDDVNQFNAENRWRKRGIAMVPTKFGISFTTKFMNQAGALVHVYIDGTVLVTHGGVEMGQGLHTKIAQIAASSFDIPVSSVFISETSTDKVPNASPTAASASSDMYGAAVLDACEQIKARMKPMALKNKHKSFAELANACFMERIDLSAHGFYITPDIGYDWKTGQGKPFSYYTYGAAFAEVEIDTLTGDFHTRSTHIVMDLGCSLNPAIDVGQIEGAFIQGLGWVALEELKWGDADHKWVKEGMLYTRGPGSYKIPTVNDIPLKFNVSLLQVTLAYLFPSFACYPVTFPLTFMFL